MIIYKGKLSKKQIKEENQINEEKIFRLNKLIIMMTDYVVVKTVMKAVPHKWSAFLYNNMNEIAKSFSLTTPMKVYIADLKARTDRWIENEGF